MKPRKKLAKGRHDHWKSLIDKLEKTRGIEEVDLILIKPLKSREKSKRHPGLYYDRIAYVYGKGSDYFGKFKHLNDCTWEI
jgi:hypothetical protein